MRTIDLKDLHCQNFDLIINYYILVTLLTKVHCIYLYQEASLLWYSKGFLEWAKFLNLKSIICTILNNMLDCKLQKVDLLIKKSSNLFCEHI